jgi:alpha-L-arabinofuranosidase
MFRVQDENAKAWWNLGGWGNARHAIEMDGLAGDSVPGRIETGRWYDIRIELKGSSVRCYLDGKLIHQASPQLKSLYAVAGRIKATQEIVVKVVNASARTQETEIDLGGVKGVRSATATVLTSANLGDENSFEVPTKVAPKSSAFPVKGTKFRYPFQPHSVTILRLEPQAAEGR